MRILILAPVTVTNHFSNRRRHRPIDDHQQSISVRSIARATILLWVKNNNNNFSMISKCNGLFICVSVWYCIPNDRSCHWWSNNKMIERKREKEIKRCSYHAIYATCALHTVLTIRICRNVTNIWSRTSSQFYLIALSVCVCLCVERKRAIQKVRCSCPFCYGASCSTWERKKATKIENKHF